MSICTNCIHKIVCAHESKYRKKCSHFLTERPLVDWTPCSKKLPEALHPYLATIKNEDGTTCVRLSYFYSKEVGWSDVHVTAWMPKPAPYKEEGDEE